MSNFLAIATVTAALRSMLKTEVEKDVNGTTVTVLSPSDPSLKDDKARLNLFLYQVTPSGAWRNSDLPERRSDGSLCRRPQAGLDLHYLLTAYGKATETDPEVHRVLGSAVRTLHERPILSREVIRAVLIEPKLADSNLAEQLEMVKVTPHALTVEELSKLWSVFFQTPYRISVAYQASVVLIDGKDRPRPSLPVATRTIAVGPLRLPLITGIEPQIANSGERIVISGQNLAARAVKVLFGTIPVVPDPAETGEDFIDVAVPGGLRAGVNTVQVLQEVDFGTPKEPHRGWESNMAAFLLRPTINVTSATRTQVKLDVLPAVGKRQQVSLLLNEVTDIAPASYTIAMGERAADATSITIALSNVKAGAYFVRLKVDDAESALDLNPASLAFGPKVNIP